MAAIAYVFTCSHVAKMLGEDMELLEAIVSNSDNLTYGSIIGVIHGDDGTITPLTDSRRHRRADADAFPCSPFARSLE